MVKADPPVANEGFSHPRVHIIAEHTPGDVLVVLRVRGEIDADGCRILDHYLRTRIPAESRYIVADLGQVLQLGAPGVRVLIEHTDRLALSGRRLHVVASSASVLRVLRLLRATHLVDVHENVSLAIAACTGPGKSVDHTTDSSTTTRATPELDELHDEVFGLRAALRTRPVIARALGVLQERYGLRDSDAALALLRDSAQRHYLPMYSLARALLDNVAPAGPMWFPGRSRLPAPSFSILHQRAGHRGNRTAILRLFVHEVAQYLEPAMVAVALVEVPGGAPRLETFHGLPAELVDYLAEEGDRTTPWRRAVDDKTRVLITDVSAAEHLPGRDLLLKTGIGAVYCTPLLTPQQSCLGVVTTCHAEAGSAPTVLQAAKLDHAATEVAAWLEWHARTVVLDALEALHHEATRSGQ